MDAANPVVFLNGQFISRSEAKLDIEDRGALFADGVYEVVRYYRGKPFALREHVARLKQSMAALSLAPTEDTNRFDAISETLVGRNKLTEAKIYWQVTRGAAPREHAFPPVYRPTVLATAQPAEPVDAAQPPRSVKAILVPDERWHRCDIKSLMLLPNVLARHRAQAAGAYEAILHRAGSVTEGTSTSVFVIRGGELWTHPVNQWILAGVTRGVLLQLARKAGIATREHAFTVDEMLGADEVFICGSTTHLAAVVGVDDRLIGGGHVGLVTAKLNHLFLEHVLHACG